MNKQEEISPIELLEETDRLIGWINFGRYAGCKTITIEKVAPITAEELYGN